jgi:hypothetical protein
MTTPPTDSPALPAWIGAAIVAGAALLAVLVARPYASSSNDGSRLATVECLVDYHTLQIDRSIFVDPPPPTSPARQLPYPLGEEYEHLSTLGTADKIFVKGHFYSEKPPVAAFYMAGVYEVLQTLTGLKARENARSFCWWMALTSSGLAYVVAVWGAWRLTQALRLRPALAVGLTASFALSSVALPYACQVNGHIPLLAVAMLLLASLSATDGAWPGIGKLLWWGTLCGLGYTFETPTGGLLGLATVALCFWRSRRFRDVVLIGLAALPWAILHHVICWSFAGTWKPVNTVVEYFDYPGSEFSRENLTGFWNHRNLGEFIVYAGGLLFGNRGFLQSNPPLFLAPVAAFVLLRRRVRETPEVILFCFWAVAVWLLYAALSMNYAGTCCTIRWFVPLLAAGYYVLALLLRDAPRYRHDFWLLSGCGAVLMIVWTWEGTWVPIPPLYWPIQGLTLAFWLGTSSLLPALPKKLSTLPWMAIGLAALAVVGAAPLVVEPRPLFPVVHRDIDWTITNTGVLSMMLGLVIGLRARADGRENPLGAARTLALAVLAGLLITVQASLAGPEKEMMQIEYYREGLNRAGPYRAELLALGVVRSLEWWTANARVADLIARWFLTFWLLWCAHCLAGRILSPTRALFCLVPLSIVLAAETCWSTTLLSDPLSGLLLVTVLLAVLADRPLCAALALGMAVLTRGSAIALVPLYLLCGRGRRPEWAMYAVAFAWFWSLWEPMRLTTGPIRDISTEGTSFVALWMTLIVTGIFLPFTLFQIRRAPLALWLLALFVAVLTVLSAWLAGSSLLPGGTPPLTPLTVLLSILAVGPSTKQSAPQIPEPSKDEPGHEACHMSDVGDRPEQTGEAENEPDNHHDDRRTTNG